MSVDHRDAGASGGCGTDGLKRGDFPTFLAWWQSLCFLSDGTPAWSCCELTDPVLCL